MIADARHDKMQIINITGDILNCPADMCIAQCVSLDGKMGAGLAKTLQKEFNLRDQFLAAERGVGYAVALRRGPRFIVQLVTKLRYFHLPRLEDFEESILNLRQFMIDNDVKALAVPQLGSGLDKLHPSDVLDVLHRVFYDDPVTIYMHFFK